MSRPVIDDVLDKLGARDREAVLLRFFEGHSFHEIGATLRLSEAAARMRVNRALEKMRTLLARRGLESTGAALSLVLSNQLGTAAPAGLAASVTAWALAGSTSGVIGGTGAGLGLLGLMSSTKATIAVSVAAILATGVALYQTQRAGEARAALNVTSRQQAETKARAEDLERQLQLATQRAEAAEADSSELLTMLDLAATTLSKDEGKATSPVTHDMVEARFKRARELARQGQAKAALEEYLWCFDFGMLQMPDFYGVRRSMLGEVARLGEQFPAARDALRDRRDAAQRRMLASATDSQAIMDFAALNHALGEDQNTLAAYDRLALDDPRRRTLGSSVFDLLLAARRYEDAAQARSWAEISTQFEMLRNERPLPPTIKDPERLRQRERNYAISSSLKNIEVLAGAGDLEHSRELVSRLLAFDASPAVRAAVLEHLTRAGHAELIKSAMTGPASH